MKNMSNELDVDVIGTQPSILTKEEEKMISDYINSHKEKMKPSKTKNKLKV